MTPKMPFCRSVMATSLGCVAGNLKQRSRDVGAGELEVRGGCDGVVGSYLLHGPLVHVGFEKGTDVGTYGSTLIYEDVEVGRGRRRELRVRSEGYRKPNHLEDFGVVGSVRIEDVAGIAVTLFG